MTVRSHFGWFALLCLGAVFCAVLLADIDAEDELKSAALVAFVQNAHWPDSNGPVTVGVIGRTGFFRLLHAHTEGKAVNGRQLQFVEVMSPVDPRCCQVLYFATDKHEEIRLALQALGSAHVLTVGETDRFIEDGGAVNLFLVDGHMAFEVSLGKLDRAGIQISSKLLRFGQIRDLPKGRAVK